MATPAILAEAIRSAQNIIMDDFIPETGESGGTLSAEKRSYCQIYNSKWRVLNGLLATQIRRLMIALFKAGVKTPKELSLEPGSD